MPSLCGFSGTLSWQVPQDRDGTFSTQLFTRYHRNEKALVLALMEMYVEGASTREVRDITEVLCGTSCSKRLVSELAGQRDAELDAWRKRPLTETTDPDVSVDARYEHVRQGGHAAQRAPVSQGVLIVAGVRADGHREILAVAVADTESEATCHQLVRDLNARGLSGVRLVTSDDHRRLKAAIDRHFQGAAWQRCQVHFARSAQAGRSGTAQGAHGGFAQDLRADDAPAGNGDSRSGGNTQGGIPPRACAPAGGRDRGLACMSFVPIGTSRPHPHYDWIGTAQ
jgi:transposase-like protein